MHAVTDRTSASSSDDRLGYRTEVRVDLAAARPYRDAGGPDDELEALREVRRILGQARPIGRELEPEAWLAEDVERGLRIVARIVRWGAHAFVLATSVRRADAPTIGGAQVTPAALEQYARSRRIDAASAEGELRALLWDAIPRDQDARPESWRARAQGLDVSLFVQRMGPDADSPPLVITAEARARR